MQVIAESTWSWLLLADGERRWLVVVCGCVGLYECAVELDPAECAAIATDPAHIDRLAREFAGSRTTYDRRHQRGFLDSPALSEAVSAWRASVG